MRYEVVWIGGPAHGRVAVVDMWGPGVGYCCFDWFPTNTKYALMSIQHPRLNNNDGTIIVCAVDKEKHLSLAGTPMEGGYYLDIWRYLLEDYVIEHGALDAFLLTQRFLSATEGAECSPT